ncbi:hypothetical protein C3E98_009170 [Pseudomonas sp. MWU13-2625]|nr:hypothetical protein C3E98_009170 [Pseudomonas sp. MWU13-2625]
MINEFFLPSEEQEGVEGTADVLVYSLFPFNGKVETFITNDEFVVVIAKQDFDTKRSAGLQCRFKADIRNGEHPYNEKLEMSIIYILSEKVPGGTRSRLYPAVYNSGTVDVNFDLVKGTLALGFKLDVQNNPTEPRLKAHGSFKKVSGLKHVKM